MDSIDETKPEVKETKNSKLSEILESLKNSDFSGATPYSTKAYKSESVVDKAEERRKQLENDALEQDIRLKKSTLDKLFWFLGTETSIIFVFAFLQGTGFLHFKLEEWSFKLLLTATLIQITFMLQVAVKHLFPEKGKGA